MVCLSWVRAKTTDAKSTQQMEGKKRQVMVEDEKVKKGESVPIQVRGAQRVPGS